MNVIILLALGLPTLMYGYEMAINHDPWWSSSELESSEVQRSYRYYYPYYKEFKRENYQWNQPANKIFKKDKTRWNYPSSNSIQKKNNFRWNYPSTNNGRKKLNYPWNEKIRDFVHVPMPTIPPLSPERKRAMDARKWPDYIPPLIMVKLPLDEPPARLD